MRVSAIWSWQPSLWKAKKIAPNLTAIVVPGSRPVKQAAKIRLDKIFHGCGLWMAWSRMLHVSRNEPRQKVPDGVHCASTSNRNFEDRQGFGAKTISVAQQWPLQQQSLVAFVDVRQMPEVQ